jgi:hypothetical protein
MWLNGSHDERVRADKTDASISASGKRADAAPVRAASRPLFHWSDAVRDAKLTQRPSAEQQRILGFPGFLFVSLR